ncbi:MAG: 4-hydroxyphenylpyruvate dioxygenase [Bdellovibrionaceae bacterium]|jgi:4-hydroxyphenylpyruvate dioxygenase|nr:4-hydroxyphenylpyruvate dioxygenase [Pseudobdellovibrionaceae bacterium]
MDNNNYCGLEGIEFVEYATPNPQMLETIFKDFGFSKTKKHTSKNINYYNQNDIHFLINKEGNSFGEKFSKDHGPSICSMGFRVKNAQQAFDEAVKRGAKPATDQGDYRYKNQLIPAIYGIGDSLVYFIDDYKDKDLYSEMEFDAIENPEIVKGKGFLAIDHLTNNVENGTMQTWADFYKNVFGFTEVRYFDIKGAKTGLISYALQSPCKSFCIPINEGTEDKSQINEYLREYKGAGIQHLAFITDDILDSLDQMKGSSIETLDIDDEYYGEVFDRVPNVTEDRTRIRNHNVLVDGDDDGYLLQIFTKNLVGPIFIEIIQRKNHNSFGEGNFGALFRSIEKDQEKRGVL